MSESRSCDRKKRYWSKRGAKRASQRAEGDGIMGLRPYRCPNCGQWHLTHADAESRAWHRNNDRSVHGPS